MRDFFYPGNLKEKKTFLYLSVIDLAILAVLIVIFTIYSAKNFSFLPLIFPLVFGVLKIRILDNSSNLWDQILILLDYLVNSQQTYFWGERE